MSTTPFLQLYAGDYLADTLDLTTEQHGAYLLLLITMWRHDARLPNNPVKLARIARVHPPRWARVWAEIEKFFTVSDDGFITNTRLLKEHEKARHKSQSRAASGAKGGKAKALKNINAGLANATVLPEHGQRSESEVKEEANASSKMRGSRLAEEWHLPQSWGEWSVEAGLSDADTRIEADKFRDYWRGVPGAKGVKLDWLATWRNWVRKAIADRQPKLRTIQGGKTGDAQVGDIRVIGGKRKQLIGGVGWVVLND